ncbi:hypothetical protein STVA_24620 [Allostella vacuolata]|nr:hypothetical protein STVA_24620 [Stella vacuolata]
MIWGRCEAFAKRRLSAFELKENGECRGTIRGAVGLGAAVEAVRALGVVDRPAAGDRSHRISRISFARVRIAFDV